MKNSSPSVGDLIEVTTERLAYGGDAVARHDGLAVFIPLAAPGERLRVRITERKKNFARALIDQILEPSPARREPPCKYFGDCGGCQLQHLTYDAQLEAKVRFVRDALERIGRIDWPGEINIRHGAEFGYRGRAQVKIDSKARRIGFNRAAANSVCDVEGCPILMPALDDALHTLRSAAIDERAHSLFDIREIEMASGDSGVSVEPSLEGFASRTLQRTVKEAVYHFSPSTFFQANPDLLEDLIDEALSTVSGELAIDLYAGVGLFTIQLARWFNRVIGVEADRHATKFALENVAANRVTNVVVHTADVELWLKRFIDTKAPPPDLVLLDPPRTSAAGAIYHIVDLKPSRITYVSCDPATLARDLRMLVDSGYKLSRITAIDLFPQTYHIETIAGLSLG